MQTKFEILCTALAHGIEVETAHGVLSIRQTVTADRQTRPMLLSMTESAGTTYVKSADLTVADLITIAESLSSAHVAAARHLITTSPRIDTGLASGTPNPPLLRLAG